MNSNREWELLSALIDGEVDEPTRLSLLASMTLDVMLQSRYRQLEALRAWTRRSARRHRASRGLQRRIRRGTRPAASSECARVLLIAWRRLRGPRKGDAPVLEARVTRAATPGEPE